MKKKSFLFEIVASLLLIASLSGTANAVVQIVSSSPKKFIQGNYSYNQLEQGYNALFSNYVLDNLKQKLDIEIEHKIWNKIRASWRASYQDRNGMRTATDSYEPFWLFNARMMWKTPSTEIYVTTANLFDTKYYDFGTISQPGRWISVGISHKINFK